MTTPDSLCIFHLKKSYQISKKNDFDVGFINDALNLSMAYIAVGNLYRSQRLLLELCWLVQLFRMMLLSRTSETLRASSLTR